MGEKVRNAPNLTSQVIGTQKYPEISVEEWLKPLLEGYAMNLTKTWREEVLDKRPQVVILSDVILRTVDKKGATPLDTRDASGNINMELGGQDLKKLSIQVRLAAKKWITMYQDKDIYQELNAMNLTNPQFYYVAVANFDQANSLFQHLKEVGLLKGGRDVHRGHDTAATRMYIESEIKKLRKLSGASGTTAAAAQLQRDIQNLTNQLTGQLKLRVKKSVDKDMRSMGIYEAVFLIPETAASNIGKRGEAALRRRIIKLINTFLKTHAGKTVEVKASKSIIKDYSETVNDMLLGKRTRARKSSKAVTARTKRIRGKAKPAKKAKSPLPPLRTSGGRFTSPMNIQAILDAKIKETVADNMGKGGALVYRTGRFASSVGVEKVMQSRQGTLTAFYTYMKAPYQTFERGFKQGSLRRDPRKLISASIREIARETLSHKLHIKTRRV